jgi:hypothetical protein
MVTKCVQCKEKHTLKHGRDQEANLQVLFDKHLDCI